MMLTSYKHPDAAAEVSKHSNADKSKKQCVCTSESVSTRLYVVFVSESVRTRGVQ